MMSRSTLPQSAAAAGGAGGPVPGLALAREQRGVCACHRAQMPPPTAAAEHGRLQIQEGQFQAKAGRASWQSVSGLCNHLLVSSNLEDFAHLF